MSIIMASRAQLAPSGGQFRVGTEQLALATAPLTCHTGNFSHHLFPITYNGTQNHAPNFHANSRS